jgi:integrase/recombinase XerD
MSDAGIPLRHIQEISGHQTLAALERYLAVTEKQKQNAISALDF